MTRSDLFPDEYYALKYPPRRGFAIQAKRGERGGEPAYNHAGYVSVLLKPCPVCNRLPVFEEASRYARPANEPAKIFIGVCPTCDLRTAHEGSLRQAVMEWQAGKFSSDMWLVCHRPKFYIEGCKMLAKKMVDDAVDETLIRVRQRQSENPDSPLFDTHGAELDLLEKFFRESPFTYDMDADGIVSDIRRAIYPELSPEWRVKIPLRLSRLWEGKKVVIECMRQTNSKKKLSKEDTHAPTQSKST